MRNQTNQSENQRSSLRRAPSFVIMTHPRTGSELLSQSLNLHPDLKVLMVLMVERVLLDLPLVAKVV